MNYKKLVFEDECALVGRILGKTVMKIGTDETDKNLPFSFIAYTSVSPDSEGVEVEDLISILELSNKAKNQIISFKQNLEVRYRHEMTPPISVVIDDKYQGHGYSEDRAILMAYKAWTESYVCLPHADETGSNINATKLHPFKIRKNENFYSAIYLPTGETFVEFDEIYSSPKDSALVFWKNNDFECVQSLGKDIYTMSLAIELTKALSMDFLHLVEEAYFERISEEVLEHSGRTSVWKMIEKKEGIV